MNNINAKFNILGELVNRRLNLIGTGSANQKISAKNPLRIWKKSVIMTF